MVECSRHRNLYPPLLARDNGYLVFWRSWLSASYALDEKKQAPPDQDATYQAESLECEIEGEEFEEHDKLTWALMSRNTLVSICEGR